MITAARGRALDRIRAALAQENRLWPDVMTVVPRSTWPPEVARLQSAKAERVWRSCHFLAVLYNEPGKPSLRLSICRARITDDGDYEDGLSWADLMRVKSECGFADSDAVELFPRDRDVVNVANMGHNIFDGGKLPMATSRVTAGCSPFFRNFRAGFASLGLGGLMAFLALILVVVVWVIHFNEVTLARVVLVTEVAATDTNRVGVFDIADQKQSSVYLLKTQPNSIDGVIDTGKFSISERVIRDANLFGGCWGHLCGRSRSIEGFQRWVLNRQRFNEQPFRMDPQKRHGQNTNVGNPDVPVGKFGSHVAIFFDSVNHDMANNESWSMSDFNGPLRYRCAFAGRLGAFLGRFCSCKRGSGVAIRGGNGIASFIDAEFRQVRLTFDRTPLQPTDEYQSTSEKRHWLDKFLQKSALRLLALSVIGWALLLAKIGSRLIDEKTSYLGIAAGASSIALMVIGLALLGMR